jgi:predicted MFS family arabinose efflux permease
MLSIALLVHAQQLSGSFALAGLVSGAYAICGAVAAPALGRLVDRRGQTNPLLVCSVLTAALLICTGVLPSSTPPALLVVLAAGAGLATPPLEASVRTLLPSLVSEPAELRALFAIESTALELTFVIGPPLALGLGALWSSGGALIACGMLMLAGTVLFSAQPASRCWRGRSAAAQPAAGSLRSAAIRTLVLTDLGTGVVFGATEVGVTATTKHLAAAAAAGPLLGLWGAGSLAGGVIATRRGGSATTMRGLAVLLAALACLHGALILGANSLAVMAVVITLAGATIAPTAASIYSLVDRVVPSGGATEAFSWLFASSASGAAAGAAVAGALAQAAGGGAAFLFGGAAGGLAVLAALAGSRAVRES